MIRTRLVAVCFFLVLVQVEGATVLAQSTPPAPTTQQSTARLFISCDRDCTWTLDSELHGALKEGQEDHLDLAPGKHKLEATSWDGQHWAEALDISQPIEEHIGITFAATSPAPNPLSVSPATEAPPPPAVGPTTKMKPTPAVQPAIEQSAEVGSNGIPKFYAQARQMLFEASVYDKTGKAGKA